jgi:DNA-binding response OmpR family regulator
VTDAERIAELQEEVAYLKAELGLVEDREKVDRLRAAYGLSPGSARLLLALYAAKGALRTTYQLLDAIPPVSGSDRDVSLVSVWVCHLRRAMGRDVVKNSFGLGYRVTETGMEQVRAVIEPHERAAA